MILYKSPWEHLCILSLPEVEMNFTETRSPQIIQNVIISKTSLIHMVIYESSTDLELRDKFGDVFALSLWLNGAFLLGFLTNNCFSDVMTFFWALKGFFEILCTSQFYIKLTSLHPQFLGAHSSVGSLLQPVMVVYLVTVLVSFVHFCLGHF